MTPLLNKQQLVSIINKLQSKRNTEADLKTWFKIGNQILAAKTMLKKGMYVK